MRQTYFGGNVDEALLKLHLLQAAAECQERYLDASQRSPHAIAVGEVAHHHLQRQRCTSIVDQLVTSLSRVSDERSRRLVTGAERGGDTSGNATTGGGYQDFWHLRSPALAYEVAHAA